MKKFPIVLIALVLVSSLAAAEDVNIWTSYPSPFGDYRQLQVEDGGAENFVFGSLQLTQPANAHLGSQVAFIKTGGPRMGLGYEQNSEIFGFGPATRVAFSPTYLAIDPPVVGPPARRLQIGMGTAAPQETLHVERTGGSSVARFVRFGSDNGSGLTLAHGRLAGALPTALDTLGYVSFAGVTGITTTAGPVIAGIATANWSPISTPSALAFRTIPDGSTAAVERMRITEDGAIQFTGLRTIDAPAVSLVGKGRIYYNLDHQRLMVSESGRPYVFLSAPGPIMKVFPYPPIAPFFPGATVDIPHGIVGPYKIYASVASLGVENANNHNWNTQVKIINPSLGIDGQITESYVRVSDQSNGGATTFGCSILVIGIPI